MLPHRGTSWCWAIALFASLALILLLPPASARRSAVKDTKIVLRVLYFKDCPGSPASAKMQGPSALRLLRDGSHTVYVNFTATKPVRSLRTAALKLNKCHDAVSHDTCEYYGTWAWSTGVCNLISVKNMMWTPLFEAFTPRLSCPVREGEYMVRNATYDVDSPTFRALFADHLWTGTLTAKDQDDSLFVCVEGGVQAFKARRETTPGPAA